MQHATLSLSAIPMIEDDQEAFVAGLLTGFRFRVCQTPEDWAAALEIRRTVYIDGSGYDVPIPDEYDSRSWLLIAEDLETGKPVGTMRVTPRASGPVEAEEYFRLPLPLQKASTLELSRFAILPEYRKGKTFLPVVSLGLFKLVRELAERVGARHLVLCSKPERVWTYEWMCFRHTGLSTRYEKLNGAEHQLLAFDLRRVHESLDGHPFSRFFLDWAFEEVEMPGRLQPVGEPRKPTPLRIAVGA